MFTGLASDPEVSRYLSWTPHPERRRDPARHHRRVQRRCRPDVADRDGATPANSSAPAGGFGRDPTRWNWGTASVADGGGRESCRRWLDVLVEEARRDPTVYRVTAYCHVDNVGSAGVLRRCGLDARRPTRAVRGISQSGSRTARLPDVRKGGAVMAGLDLRALSVPVIVAPMAGGPTTPELAAAGTNAGGLGFLAAGYLSADALAERITAARALTSGPLGVNLFVVRSSAAWPDAIHRYAQTLESESKRYERPPRRTALRRRPVGGEARGGDGPEARGGVVHVRAARRPPSARRCAARASPRSRTVTTLAEAELAVALGVDAVAAQGPAAGGHRGTLDPVASPPTQPLDAVAARDDGRRSTCRSSRRVG